MYKRTEQSVWNVKIGVLKREKNTGFPLHLKLQYSFVLEYKNSKTGLVFAHKSKYDFYTQWTVRQMRGKVIPGNLFEIQAKTTAFLQIKVCFIPSQTWPQPRICEVILHAIDRFNWNCRIISRWRNYLFSPWEEVVIVVQYSPELNRLSLLSAHAGWMCVYIHADIHTHTHTPDIALSVRRRSSPLLFH